MSTPVSKLVLYKPVMRQEFASRYGMVGRYLYVIANRVLRGAKRQVGVETGALRKSLHIKYEAISGMPAVKIGSSLSYAHMHHDGTAPHTIEPKNGGVLVFNKGTRVIRTTVVRHPGTKANRYLSDQLRIHIR